MHIGVALFFTAESIRAADLGRALEERGFESLWVPEHSHIPLSRGSEWPQGGALPQKYFEVMDPFVTLTAAATATTSLKLATGICLVPQRDLYQTAKTVATLDLMSEGRFLFGIGAGWNADEMANHGVDFKTRMKLMREKTEAMRAIWTEDTAEYQGDMVEFGPLQTWPKPAQAGGPPVYVGGAFPYGARRALRYGDAWLPHAKRPHYHILDMMPEYRAMAAEAGRNIPVTVFGGEPDPDMLKRYQDAGIERVVVNLDPMGRDQSLAELDEWVSAGVLSAVSGA
jgi:probable F420-dependent oxidoreductase